MIRIEKCRTERSAVGATLLLPLSAAFALLALAACSKPTPITDTSAKVAYFTAAPAASDDATYTGVVHARTESNLGFRVAGKVVERLVDPGDNVKQGQALMKLDGVDYALATSAARAAVTAAFARNVQAKSDELRLRKLLASGAVSAQAYEQSKAAADAAVAQLDAERARENQTAHQAEYALLRADMDGVVMDVPVEPGQVVSAGQTVVKLARRGAREAIINIPENALEQAKRAATASLYAQAGTQFPARLRELSAAADPMTRTYQARYTLTGAGEQAPLGATVTVHLTGGKSAISTMIAAPVGALIDKGQGPAVWVIDSKTSTVSLRPVKIGRLGEETVGLASGVNVGEHIVAFGAHLLKAGQKVALLTPVRTGGGS